MAIQIETFDSFVCSELQQKISRPSVLPGRFTPGIISLSEFTAPGEKNIEDYQIRVNCYCHAQGKLHIDRTGLA